MSVFSRFRRKSVEVEATSTEEAEAAAPTAEPTGESATESAEAGPKTPEKPAAAVAEGVEIPRQQSAEKVADNEAGEGVRK